MGIAMRLAMAASLALVALMLGAAAASAVAPTIAGTAVSEVTSNTATLETSINPNSKATRYRFEYGPADCASNSCTAIPVPEGELTAGSSPVTVKAKAEGLTPGSVYHFRVVARNGTAPADKVESPDRLFATFSTPISGLPDNRAYEQASPVDKDGGDAIGIVPQIKAAPEGGAITFSSTVGMPGGEGAQEFPVYLSSRGADGWSTRGLFPPAGAGQEALVVGWLPGFTQVFSSATKLGSPSTGALLAKPGSGGALEELTPYLPEARYTYVGASADGSLVVFETRASLGSPPGTPDVSNVYAWDRDSGEVFLVSVDNNAQPFAKGAFGGSYDWALGMTPTNLSQGGAARDYYTQDQHAVSDDGAVFFTEAGSGQLYMRVNPTRPQSAMDAGKCTEPEMACTLHVSESKRTPPDAGGPRPAAFMGAAADGSAAYFTSPEKLTDDANTGPVQPQPMIGRADIDDVTDIEPQWLANHRGVGVAVDSEFIYWADPVAGTIGRAELDGDNADDEFIEPGPITVEEETEPGSGQFETLVLPSKPRYVAVDAGHIYWTNTGDGQDGNGSIGRADIDGTPASVEPDCVKGASNPQGIAVNATHIYWANAGTHWIGRAKNACEEAEQEFQRMSFETAETPGGVTLTATKLYWAAEEDSGNSSIYRVPLAGEPDREKMETFALSTTAKPRGLTAAGDDLYWAAQGEKSIGHATWPDAQPSPTTLEKELIELDGSPSGVAVDAEHIYWSTDGETLPSPGNDLYRFEPDGEGGGELSDLTPEPLTLNGAEVQGVIAVSGDGSRVYFTANADLDAAGPAQAGDCQGPLRSAKGKCSLYLWHAGATSFVARLDATGANLQSDAVDWAPTTSGLTGGSEFQKTAFLSADGQTLLFRSQEQLTAYDNEGISQLYRFREGEPIICVSCNPSGAAAKSVPTLGTIKPSALRGDAPASLASRNLSADGNRVFFETSEALVATDTNGQGGCPPVGSTLQGFPACFDVYEWEAPDTDGGSCTTTAPAFSPLNEGCLYLISTGKDNYPSFFADASTSGDDVFFFTRQGLVGQDKDELLDVYDARVGGGLAAQSPAPVIPCDSAEACHGPIPAAPAEGAPTSQTFVGPGNEVAKPKPKKAKKHAKHKKKHKVKKNKKKQKHRARRAGVERGARR